MSFKFPLMLDVRDRAVLVVGGGAVAVRKVRALLDAGATFVTVVSPEYHDQMPDGVRRVVGTYHEQLLDGIDLAFAATNLPEVNDAVVRDCGKRRIWVNRADTDEHLPGDFATPAQLRKGPVTVTVSAGSAALTARIRDGIADRWDDRWTQMAEAMRVLRPLIVGATHLAPEARSALLRELTGDEAFDVLTKEGFEALTAWVRGKITPK